MEELMKTIGYRVKELREKHNLTQFELACDINTDKSMISALERDIYKNITVNTLYKISSTFKVVIMYFFS